MTPELLQKAACDTSMYLCIFFPAVHPLRGVKWKITSWDIEQFSVQYEKCFSIGFQANLKDYSN